MPFSRYLLYLREPSPFLNWVLLIFSRVEALARMCVTGFLFDPEVFMFSQSSSVPSNLDTYNSNPGVNTDMARQTALGRGNSITRQLDRIQQRLIRPFTLSTHPPPSAYPQSGYAMTALPRTAHLDGYNSAVSTAAHLRDGSMTTRMTELTHRIHSTIRQPSEPTYLSLAMRSDSQAQSDTISLPFRLSIDHLHNKMQRNVPYLRQSWNRIDLVAIVSFWITFGLSVAGIERGMYHVGVFRAMSVIRTARLLTITSGTTVGHRMSATSLHY